MWGLLRIFSESALQVAGVESQRVTGSDLIVMAIATVSDVCYSALDLSTPLLTFRTRLS